MKPLLGVLVLSLSAFAACADVRPPMTAAEEARALIGLEYTSRMPSTRIAPHLSCENVGGGMLVFNEAYSDEWGFGMIHCRDRSVIALERKVGNVGRHVTWHILDTLLLPPYEEDPDPARPDALRLFFVGECELDGKRDTFFMALVRWGEHDRIDSRTGVEQVFGFDVERGRIVPLSPERVVCYRPDPP